MNGGSGAHSMDSLSESGGAPGVNLVAIGGPLASSSTSGSGGGYGSYGSVSCFALPSRARLPALDTNSHPWPALRNEKPAQTTVLGLRCGLLP